MVFTKVDDNDDDDDDLGLDPGLGTGGLVDDVDDDDDDDNDDDDDDDDDLGWRPGLGTGGLVLRTQQPPTQMVSVGSSPQLRIENQPGHSSGAFFSRKMCVWGRQGLFLRNSPQLGIEINTEDTKEKTGVIWDLEKSPVQDCELHWAGIGSDQSRICVRSRG